MTQWTVTWLGVEPTEKRGGGSTAWNFQAGPSGGTGTPAGSRLRRGRRLAVAGGGAGAAWEISVNTSESGFRAAAAVVVGSPVTSNKQHAPAYLSSVTAHHGELDGVGLGW